MYNLRKNKKTKAKVACACLRIEWLPFWSPSLWTILITLNPWARILGRMVLQYREQTTNWERKEVFLQWVASPHFLWGINLTIHDNTWTYLYRSVTYFDLYHFLDPSKTRNKSKSSLCLLVYSLLYHYIMGHHKNSEEILVEVFQDTDFEMVPVV